MYQPISQKSNPRQLHRWEGRAVTTAIYSSYRNQAPTSEAGKEAVEKWSTFSAELPVAFPFGPPFGDLVMSAKL